MIDLKLAPTTKWLWVDLEMTGLNSAKDRILEVAVIVTDFDFKMLDSYSTAIYQAPKVIKKINDWSKEQHAKSGLMERVKTAPKEAKVQQDIIKLIKKNFKKEPAVLAGNSIYFDRQFIKQWWPKIEELLHYRMLDVSSFKLLMQGKYGVMYTKKEVHLAFDDINESIAELKFYLDYFNRIKR